MVDHRLPARMAGEYEATGAAKDKRRIAAPIQHDDRLLTARQRLRQEITQIVGEDRAPPATQLCTHIDGTHTRQGLRTDALRHSEEHQFPGERPRIRLKRWRCAPHNEDRPMPTRKDLCDNACVIARGLILLIGHILFLIEDDAADIPRRRKESRPCADDDPRLAAPYPEDGIVALGE